MARGRPHTIDDCSMEEEHIAIRADLERNLDGHLQESKQALRSVEGSSRRRRQRAGQREAEEPRRPWARSDGSGSDSDTLNFQAELLGKMVQTARLFFKETENF